MGEWMKESAELKKTPVASVKVISTPDMDLIRDADGVFWRLYDWIVYLSDKDTDDEILKNYSSSTPIKEKRMEV